MDGYHWLCMVIDCYGLLLNVVDFFVCLLMVIV